MEPVKGQAAVAALLALILSAWAVFSWALLAQHRAYNSNAFDLAFFDQIVWNTAQGRPFQTSFVPYNFLGQHVEPVLLLFAGVYRFRPDVEILLLTQAAVATWAAVPLFVAARRLLASATAALMVAAAYLLSPHLHGAVLFDFHPEVIGTAAVFGAFALLVAGQPKWALAAAGSLVLLKEDAALAAAGFALIVWSRGGWRYALTLLAGSLLYLVLVAGVLMPAVRGGPGDLQERYGYLGTDAAGVVRGAVRHPDLVWENLSGPVQREALAYLLGTQALLPLAGPAALAAAPSLALNLLATHPPQRELTLHYVILPFSVLIVASVLAMDRLRRWRPLQPVWRRLRVSPQGRTLLLAGVLLLAAGSGWLTGSALGPRRFHAARYRQTPHTAAVARVLARVPDAASVSAQSGLAPHLSQRRELWEFPRLEGATYAVVDPTSWRSSQADGAGAYARGLASLPARGYCLLAEDDGVQLWAQGERCV